MAGGRGGPWDLKYFRAVIKGTPYLIIPIIKYGVPLIIFKLGVSEIIRYGVPLIILRDIF
jgi:hypothetical protein